MNEKKDLLERVEELRALQPQPITFKGKARLVHFFHEGTADRFDRVLETASENDTMKDRHSREVRLLAIVLADLHGSSPLFRKVRSWLWEIRLSHSRYNEIEAMMLLDAAVQRMHQQKMIALYLAIIMANTQASIDAAQSQLKEIEQLFNEKVKDWKGETV